MPPFEGEITVGHGDAARRIAYLRRDGSGPEILFLGGFMSDMRGAKGEALDAFAERTGRAITRFDYSGHGASDGRFEDGTISRWLEEACAILYGASYGGYAAMAGPTLDPGVYRCAVAVAGVSSRPAATVPVLPPLSVRNHTPSAANTIPAAANCQAGRRADLIVPSGVSAGPKAAASPSGEVGDTETSSTLATKR